MTVYGAGIWLKEEAVPLSERAPLDSGTGVSLGRAPNTANGCPALSDQMHGLIPQGHPEPDYAIAQLFGRPEATLF